RGLSADSAAKTIGHLLTLTQARAVALLDADGVLAFAGAGADHHDPSEWVALAAHAGRDDRLHVENRIRCSDPNCPIGSAVLAPLVVREERAGTFLALFSRGWRLTPEETRTASSRPSSPSPSSRRSQSAWPAPSCTRCAPRSHRTSSTTRWRRSPATSTPIPRRRASC